MSAISRISPTDTPYSNSFESLVDSDECAALLKIHPKTLQRLARSGQITGIQIGNLWRFPGSDLVQWIKSLAKLPHNANSQNRKRSL